jgi:hypothetical protein
VKSDTQSWLGRSALKTPVDPIQRARRLHIADGGAHHLAAAHALQAQALHQTLDRAAGNLDTLPVHLLPDLVGAIDPHVGLPDALNRRHQGVVTLGACTAQLGIALMGSMAPVA